MEILRNAKLFLNRIAIVDSHESIRYSGLLANALRLAQELRQKLETGGKDSQIHGPRVAFLAPPGRAYLEATLGTWLAGGIAVPLSLSHPEEELNYTIENCGASSILSTAQLSDRVKGIAKRQRITHDYLEEQAAPGSEEDTVAGLNDACKGLHRDAGALIIYTSGTTGRPKGALHSFAGLDAQIRGLCSSWQWQPEDRILHTLPLHHIHGIVNAAFCPLAVGACVEFQSSFSPTNVWEALKRETDPISVFMGVPTMYNYLLSHYQAMDPQGKAAAENSARRLRLTVSGSAACPLPTMQRWQKLSGQLLLERYGMTETGMILSNPYEGERKPGMVGTPLPGVQVKLVGEGELAVKGGNLFQEYWEKPEATRESFTDDDYFLTGDTASQDESGYWKILGRTSTDIIKSGGYKLSALQIEDVLLDHPDIAECAVIGIPDDDMGEVVTAIVACKSRQVTLEELQAHAKHKLAAYQLPRQLQVLDEIPRNAMGKINKKMLHKELFPDKF